MAQSFDWSEGVFKELKRRNFETVCTIPDGGLVKLLNRIEDDADMRLVTLSTEEEGMGFVTGQWLGGKRALMTMQSSGVGNCINALGYPAIMRAPCPMLVTMRGVWGEFNPWQVQMGMATQNVLESIGVKCFPVDKPEEVTETFVGAVDLALNGGFSTAVLISQRVIGAKGFGQD